MDTRTFREIVRTVTVSYPVPFMFACLVAVLLFCYALAAAVPSPMSWVFAATGLLAFLAAVGPGVFAVGWKPELLRSERHTLVNRVLDMIGDSDTATGTRAGLGKTLTALLSEDKTPKERTDRAEAADGDNANERSHG